MKTSHIINADQAAILETLRCHTGKPPSLTELQNMCGISVSRYWRFQTELRERCYIRADRPPTAPKNSPLFITLEMAGRRALHAHYRRLAVAQEVQTECRVPAPRNDLFQRDVYKDPGKKPALQMEPYYRNAGNTHIGSRGVRC